MIVEGAALFASALHGITQTTTRLAAAPAQTQLGSAPEVGPRRCYVSRVGALKPLENGYLNAVADELGIRPIT